MKSTCNHGASTRWITRVAATMSMALLTLSAAPAHAANEAPHDVMAYAVGPGAINVLWKHTADDVYYFVVETESPYGFVAADRDKRIFTVSNLQPSHTYRLRVCAVYLLHRTCSEGYAAATTQPAEAQKSGSAPPAPPRPAQALAFADPRIKGELVRLDARADSPLVMRLTWLNPITDPVQMSLLESVSWMRNDRGEIAQGGTQITDRQGNGGAAYYLCVRNAVHSRCSNAVGVLAPSAPSQPALSASRSTPACAAGFVMRKAGPSDLVCVTAGSRVRVRYENHTRALRVQPGGGAYGPDTCRVGYVWREAYAGDLVCVSPERRAAVQLENRLGPSHRAAAIDPRLTPLLSAGHSTGR